LLVAAARDAAVVEVHHTGFGVDAGNHHDVVIDVTVARGVPDGFGVDRRDHPLGQILLEPPDRRLTQSSSGEHSSTKPLRDEASQVADHCFGLTYDGERFEGAGQRDQVGVSCDRLADGVEEVT
jgi:hypothetical protein